MKKTFLSLLLMISMVFSPALFTAGSAAQAETPENILALWEAGETRDKIVTISDIHLGIEDRYSETVENLPLLIQFLKRLQNTRDVRELVIAGDFLDEWYLPVYYPRYTDQRQFYMDVIANNQDVIDELNHVIDSSIKLVYVIGNHDMTLEAGILQEAIPGIVQAVDAKGLGAYYTGDRKEIVIEHGHRYDVFSAPDTVTNAELAGNDETIFPAGYFYARYAATWVLEGKPVIAKDLPSVSKVPDKTDTDQFGAYLYYSILKTVSSRMTPKEAPEDKIFDMRVSGFDDAYSFLDFYPAQQEDGTISAPVLFCSIHRTWDERQAINKVKVPNSFIEAVAGTLDWRYFSGQAETQYLSNPDESVDVVVFGHTHVPVYDDLGGGKYYINDGTWIDDNTDRPEATRTFAVITTGEVTTAGLYRYLEDGSVSDVSEGYSSAQSK
ncbi:MAG: metallophosphoesterase [Christensenellales bacterium]